MNSIIRGLELLFALLFLFGAAVQYNDPDPIRWMAIYLAACGACVAAACNLGSWWFPALVGLVALIWGLVLAPRAFPNVRLGELVEQWEMKDVRVEEGREMYGLFIIFVVMTLVGIARWFATRSS
jgi:Transmembrane family 220, helix